MSDSIDRQELLSLREKTGADIQSCKRAIEYAKVHDGCTSLGYLKAITYAVATKSVSFEERVRMFSDGGGKDDLISRQAAIDVLARFLSNREGGNAVWWKPVAESVIDVLPSAEPEQRWIPCSERLPEQYGNYLVSYRTDDFESDIGTFDPDRINSDTGEWSACDANGFYWVASKGLEVIAWMPLPEPYKGGEQDE